MKKLSQSAAGIGSQQRSGHATDSGPEHLFRRMSYFSCATAALTLSATGWGNGA